MASIKNEWVNKYFPGVAVLQFPFFIAAHTCALTGLSEPDGFSSIYQYFFGFGAIFYAWLGLRFLRKLLRLLNVGENPTDFTVLLMFFGTHLFYYTIYASFQPHAYLFFVITTLSYFLFLFFNGNRNLKTLGFISALTGFIAIIRPFDILFFLCLPVLGFKISEFRNYILSIKKNTQIIVLLLPFLILIFLLIILWKIQCGRFIIDPYGGERFYFDKPHISDILFSFRRGWLLYTPLAGLSFIGLFFMPDKRKALVIFGFFVLLSYVLSCWWSWTFGTNFGLRPYVDFTVLTAILFAFLIDKNKSQILQKFTITISIFFMALNLWQTSQFQKGIIHPEYTSSETYLRYFFTYHTPASYPIPPKIILQQKVFAYDFEESHDELITELQKHGGNKSTFINHTKPYALGKKFAFPNFFKQSENYKIRVKAYVKGKITNGKPVLALDFREATTNKNLHWHSLAIDKYIQDNNWNYIETGTHIPNNCSIRDSIAIFFWNTEGKDTLYIDDVKIEFLKTDSTYELNL
jgi:hypothetical protein